MNANPGRDFWPVAWEPSGRASPGTRRHPPLKAPSMRFSLPALHALHDPLHLHELLQEPVDVLDLHAGAGGDTAAAGAVDDRRVAALLAGHGIDDGDLAAQSLSPCSGRHGALPGSPRLGSLSMRALTPPIFCSCSSWLLRSAMSKPLPLTTFLASRWASSMIDLALDLLDQADDVAHAENARRHALRVEGLERLGLLAHADEHDGLAGDLAHRQRRATARIAVGLGQDHAGEIERRAEGARRIHGVLAGHRVDDEQALGGSTAASISLHLVHQLSSTCRRPAVSTMSTSKTPRCACVERVTRDVRGGACSRRCAKNSRAHLLGETLELQHRGGAADVRAHQQHALLLAR